MIRVRCLRIVLTATVCAAALHSGLVVLEGQLPRNPFLAWSADGIPIHLMPTLNVLQQLRTTDEPAESTQVGNANVFPSPYGGGNIWDHGNVTTGEIANAGVVAVYWNPAVANSTSTSLGYSTIRNQIDAFVTAFSDGVNWHDASTADYTIIQQYGTPQTSIAAPLRNGGNFVDSQTTTATIDDSQIRAYLANLFTTGALTARADTVYAIFFPPGMRVNAGWGASCTQFCGYHSYLYWGFP